MITGRTRFNIYLLCLVLLAAFASGCQSPEKKRQKQVSLLKIHLEVPPDSLDFSQSITLFRDKPATLRVDKSPFLTEAQVAKASVVEDQGGWALQIDFDKRGTWLLEQYTTTNPGRRMAVFSQFGGEKKESRWVAAPLINRRISNGVLRFTPDASREEADEIILGLNNLAKQVSEKSKW